MLQVGTAGYRSAEATYPSVNPSLYVGGCRYASIMTKAAGIVCWFGGVWCMYACVRACETLVCATLVCDFVWSTALPG